MEHLQTSPSGTPPSAPKHPATLTDLYREPDKAELVDGRLVSMSPTGGLPGRVGFILCRHLYPFEKQAGGYVYPDNVGFVVDLPNRKSFSPDIAFHQDPPPKDLRFMQGAPVFAVEIRSENDYGPAAEQAMAAKRADYFAAGTLVVWDVDLRGDETVRVFRDGDSETPAAVYGSGSLAEAEPAVPGWVLAVDKLFS